MTRTPKRSAVNRPLAGIERLEHRLLATADISLLNDGTLRIVGDNHSNYIHVTQVDGWVRVFNQDLTTGQEIESRFNEQPIRRLEILGGPTYDSILNSTGLPSTIHGGDSFDDLVGGWGADDIFGGNGSDYIAGGEGNDRLFGESGADRIFGENGHDYIEGDNAAITLLSLAREKVFGVGAFNDEIDGGAGDDEIFGQIGRDFIEGGSGDDTLYGGRGDDLLYGEDLKNTIEYADGSRFGNDLLVGEDGQDILAGGFGNDSLQGGNHADRLYGGWGNDVLMGGTGDDILFGENGNDRLLGNQGVADQLFGGEDDDWLDAGSPSELVSGDAGMDINAWVTAPTGVLVDAVQQRTSDTCWALAPIAALTRAGFDLSKLITYHGNYQYSVQLFNRSIAPAVPKNTPIPSTVWVNFDGQTSSADAALHRAGEGTTWVTILNRAVAALRGSTVETVGGGYAGDGIFMLTGRACTEIFNTLNDAGEIVGFNPSTLTVIQESLRNNRAIVAGTVPQEYLASNQVVSSHVYTIVGVSTRLLIDGKRQTVLILRNPWAIDTDGRPGLVATGANDGLITVAWTHFARNFGYVNIL